MPLGLHAIFNIMEKKKILLIEDDTKRETQIREALPAADLSVLSNLDDTISHLQKQTPDLVIIDLDHKGLDGMQLFRELHQLAPRIGTIMLSSSNDIPLAVKAAKLGAADFIKRPFTPDQLRLSVERNLLPAREAFLIPAQIGWLQGESAGIDKMYAEIREALKTSRNIILFGEAGIDKSALVQYLHGNGEKSKRKLRTIDLDSFRRENMEALFWATVQEIMSEPEIITGRSEEDLCGTLYLEKIENLDPSFKTSLFNFFVDRKGKLDREITVVIGVSERKAVRSEKTKEYCWIEVPPLRERKGDLPYLLNYYMKFFSEKHNRPVKGIAVELLNFLAAYDFPGNYVELQSMIEEAVLRAKTEILDFADLPLDFQQIVKIVLNHLDRSGKLRLSEAKREFEKYLFKILLAKSQNDLALLARFMDIPRTVLSERIEELGLSIK